MHNLTSILIRIGDDGVRVWNLPNADPAQIPDFEPATLGQITAIKWINEGNKDMARLLIGTGLGNVILWKYDATEVSLPIANDLYAHIL